MLAYTHGPISASVSEQAAFYSPLDIQVGPDMGHLIQLKQGMSQKDLANILSCSEKQSIIANGPLSTMMRLVGKRRH